MNCYGFVENLKKENNDAAKMLLVCLFWHFGHADIAELKKKYGEIVVAEFEKYFE